MMIAWQLVMNYSKIPEFQLEIETTTSVTPFSRSSVVRESDIIYIIHVCLVHVDHCGKKCSLSMDNALCLFI